MISVAVLSDLHACPKEEERQSSFELIGGDSQRPTPANELCDFLKHKAISADLLCCPGDLGDRAHPLGVIGAWNRVHDVAESLGTSDVFVTPGNHDVDSRGTVSSDPFGALRELRPVLPAARIATASEDFWVSGVSLVDACDIDVRLILLNSCSQHGLSNDAYKRGMVTNDQLELVKSMIDGSSARSLNLLLCHHHPHPHEEIGLGAEDLMENGQLLLDTLAHDNHCQWLVIHGHKHHPKISYAAGETTRSPVVLASGSLSATLFPELQTRARNQFHIITVDPAAQASDKLRGEIKSWEWAVGAGWREAGVNSGLPHITGFGARTPVSDLARTVAARVSHSGNHAKWSDIASAEPDVRHLLPKDFEEFVEILKADHRTDVRFDRVGIPVSFEAEDHEE